MGIDRFVLGRDGIEALKARAYEPTANIAGIIGGYTGPGAKDSAQRSARQNGLPAAPNLDPQAAMEKPRRPEKSTGSIRLRLS
jgi:hypothetical protein